MEASLSIRVAGVSKGCKSTATLRPLNRIIT